MNNIIDQTRMGCSTSTITEETRGTINIYYGTTTGNSARLAQQFATYIRSLKFIPKVINLSEFTSELILTSKLNIFFVSTYGVGNCTMDSQNFYDWIFANERQNDDFKDMNYAIFALGNTYHDHFCQFGMELDQRLSELGAKRLVEMGTGDAAKETTEKEYMEWIQKGLYKTLELSFPLITASQTNQELHNIKIKYLNKDETSKLNNLSFQAEQYEKSANLIINQIRELKKKPSKGNSTLFIDVLTNGLQYKTAMNIAIYPENNDIEIQDLCRQLQLNDEQIFEVITNTKQQFPTPISIKTYLKKYCDFLGPISRRQLTEIANSVKDTQIKELLLKQTGFENRELFQDEYTKKQENLLSILKKYNVKNLTLQQLIEICPQISPRYFTIASSNNKYPSNIHIVASELIINQQRIGLCSQYLRNLKQGDKIKCFLSESKFIFPKQQKAPVLLIGPGAGIAPMRGLIQERDYYLEKGDFKKNPLQGSMKLYFGCRSPDEYLFQEELKEYENMGTLSELKVAFSRINPKQYVTEFLDSRKLLDHLTLDGVIYICGSTKMGKDIINKLEEMFVQLQNVMPYAAYKKIQELEQKKQLITEFWG